MPKKSKKYKLTKKELETIYLVLKGIEEGIIDYLDKEWEEDYYNDDLIDLEEIEKISKKLKKILEEKSIENLEKSVLLRKFHPFRNDIDEAVFSKLERAFENLKEVEVKYFSLSSGDFTQRKLKIYYLSRKYMIAYCYLRKEIRKFRVSRIRSVKILKKRYTIPKNFNKNNFL